MKRKTDTIPTKAEFEILQVLWKSGPATVKSVNQGMGRDAGYTTTLKLLQIMTEKDLVRRHEEGRAHVYTANISEKQGTSDFIRELVERVFGGSPKRLVMQVLGVGKTTSADLGEIRRLIQEIEAKKK